MRVQAGSFLTYLLFTVYLQGTIQLDLEDNLLNHLCLIPRGADQVARALLLQQCLSTSDVSGNETVCYPQLGCFPMMNPWTSVLRPLPSPDSPESIQVGLKLFTRTAPKGYSVTLWPNISLQESDFQTYRPATVFITHGFLNEGGIDWVLNLKDAYLSRVDANVFTVDWGKGAMEINYLQAASNTRIVGAELARFGRYLVNEVGVNKSSLHLIGHSLGSHISGYMAKGMMNSSRVGRITALDPAQPAFDGADPKVRLAKNDADFIDAIHTDAKAFLPFFGFGMLSPVGSVDFYINGGSLQPGCSPINPASISNITSIKDLGTMPMKVISNLVSCSHSRAHELFTDSLKNPNCLIWGRKMTSAENAMKLTTLGTLAITDPLVKKVTQCTEKTCTVLGLDTPKYKARGKFAVTTKGKPPYCDPDPAVAKVFRSLTSTVGDVLSGLTSIISAPLNIKRSPLRFFGWR